MLKPYSGRPKARLGLNIAPAGAPAWTIDLRSHRSFCSCSPLIFELIPQVMHHKCVRVVLSNDVWRLLRKMTIEAAGKRSGEYASGEQLGCHEVWWYLPPGADVPGAQHVMKLVGLRALCHLCHIGKHIGYTLRNPALYRQVKEHLMDLYLLPESGFS